MAAKFGAKSTTEDVLVGVDLKGKRILVTGVSAGLGVETARALVAHGADVTGAARDLEKAKRATSEVRKTAGQSGGSFEEFGKTEDGFETQFGTNHLGHFLFVNRIAKLIKVGGRLVNLSSSGHRFSDVNLNDPNSEVTSYEPLVAYGRSKTANVLFAVEFDRRHGDRGVRATAVHPGGIATELARHMPDGAIEAWVQQIQEQRATAGEPPFEFKSIPQGAATSVWAGVVASTEEVGGNYCEDCQVGKLISADSQVSTISKGVRGYALDPESAKALWKKSEEMVDEIFA
jgi:NAD(P)-dependent dehydrogenase (short-subunit alcohol dehydrogenase family)